MAVRGKKGNRERYINKLSFACIHFHEKFCIVIKYSHYAVL